MTSSPINSSLTNSTRDVCAVVVTFNPGERLLGNITALRPQVQEVVVVDNGSANLGPIQRLEQCGTKVFYNEENLGIAAALNIGMKYALKKGYTWIATFDQDSQPPLGFVKRLLEAYDAYPGRDRIAILSPVYRDEATGTVFQHGGQSSAPFQEIVSTMTSGNLVKADTLTKTGLFEEDLFIDYVDHEFCLRARKSGFGVLESRTAILGHNLGETEKYTKFGLTFHATNHSPLRRYYNARNRLVVYRRYLTTEPRWILKDIFGFLKEVGKIILVEENKREKLSAVGEGLWHGVTGKMGQRA